MTKAWSSIGALVCVAMVAACGGSTMDVDAGDAGTADGSMTDGARDMDVCSGLTLCTTAGASCSGTSLVTCAPDAHGCLVETRTDCGASAQVCDASSGTAACVDPCSLIPAADRCAAASRTCTGSSLEVCAADTHGCFVLTRTDCAASPGGVCDTSGAMPMCVLPADPCAGVAGACTTAGTSCDADTLVTCAPNAFGCLVATRADCTSRGGACSVPTGAPAACTFTTDPCAGVTQCTTEGSASCDGPSLVTCDRDAFGCLVENRTDCTATTFGFCDPAAAPRAMCSVAAVDPCMGTTPCGTTPGRSCTDRSTLSTCAPNAFGCYVATDTDCTATSEVCDASGPTAACVSPCSLVPTCPTGSYCDAGSAVTCTADADGCLVASSRTACPFSGCTVGGGAASCTDPCTPAASTAVLDCTSGVVAGNTATGTTALTNYACSTFSYPRAESVYRFLNPVGARVHVVATRGSGTGDMDLYALDASDGSVACDATTPCLAHSTGTTATETVDFDVRAGEYAYLAYDLFGSSGTDTTDFTLTVSCIVPTCGDGNVEAFETCDDGNTTAGDGCSATCATETGFVCYGMPSSCGAALTCGNGVTEAGETCDDGNTTSGDGCSATCTTEGGYGCTGTPSTCTFLCGNGVLNTGETCDDGNASGGDGCSATCTTEAGYNCTGTPSVCVPQAMNALCGTATAVTGTTTITGEDTRAGGTSPSGTTCGSVGSSTLYYAVIVPAFTRVTAVVTPSATMDPVLKTEDTCGAAACNARVDAGNAGAAETTAITNSTGSPVTQLLAVNGYSASSGGTYDVTFTFAVAACGNGVLDAGETCDDGNASGGDGCSATCTIESGYVCFGAPSTCVTIATNATCAGATAVTATTTLTGEDLRRGGPRPTGTTCGTSSGNSALYYAVTVPAYSATRIVATPTGAPTFDPVIDVEPACGAAACTVHVDSGGSGTAETTTLTNATGAPVTQVVAVFNYSSAAVGPYGVAFTFSTCGNGVVEGAEACDDGNNAAGDGCSPSCVPEAGYLCTGSPSTCRIPYTMTTIPAACLDTSTGTAFATTGDDSATPTTALPFAFSFFGAAQTQFGATTNGLVQLFPATGSTASTAFSNATIPTASTPNNIIAPFWDDLQVDPGNEIRQATLGAPGSQVLVLEWSSALVRSVAGSAIRFQVQLYETTGVVELHYCASTGATGTNVDGASATIGIENATGTAGSLFSYNTASVTWGTTAVRFTPNP